MDSSLSEQVESFSWWMWHSEYVKRQHSEAHCQLWIASFHSLSRQEVCFSWILPRMAQEAAYSPRNQEVTYFIKKKTDHRDLLQDVLVK